MYNYEEELNEYEIGSETLHLSQDEHTHLVTLFDENNISYDDPDWEIKLNPTDLANVYFTIHRIDDAWKIIEDNKEDIDFETLTNATGKSPFFQIKRDAHDVFKYMYDNNIIDDNSYMYFEVLGRRLNDIDFWKNKFEGKTTSEKLMMIHDSYNGISPFELGLVVLTNEDERNLIFNNLEDDEKLDDFIIGQYPGVFFDTELLINLIGEDHLDSMKYDRYFSILLQMIVKDAEDSDDDSILNNFWNFAYDRMGTRIVDVNVDDKEKLYSFIESDVCKKLINDMRSLSIENNVYSSYTLDTMLVNSLEFMSHPHIIMNKLHELGLRDDYVIDGSLLFEKNYPYIITYSMCDVVDTSNFILKYPFPTGINCVYDISNNLIYINGETKTYDKYDLAEFDFVDKYLNDGEIDQDIMEKCQSIDDYEEHVYATKHFNEMIQKALG